MCDDLPGWEPPSTYPINADCASRFCHTRISYPVAVDSDGKTWKAYENRSWPSIYLIDKQGQIRYRWEGELEYQNAGGDRIVRAKIKELVAEDKQ